MKISVLEALATGKTVPTHVLLASVLLAGAALATDEVVVDGQTYASWAAYWGSPAFQAKGGRCGTVITDEQRMSAQPPSDCTMTETKIGGAYVPGDIYEVTVVVHVIRGTGGVGDISEPLVQSQIDVLNEDYQALAGTLGEDGTNGAIRFKLATEDPSGNPTNGITWSTNQTWFDDGGSYWTTLAWDPTRYCNVYTNSAGGGGILGYAYVPQGGGAGSSSDRIVILWSAFGRPGQGGGQYALGRTLTHEMGHYLGLLHTFQGGCAASAAPACFQSGDTICDTNPESAPVYLCPGSSETCGAPSPDPFHNYMDYSDDDCMTNFTAQQVQRMRCTLIHYRPGIYETIPVTPVATTRWSDLKSLWR